MNKQILAALLTIACATNSFASSLSEWLEENPNSAAANCYDLVNAMSPNTLDVWVLDQKAAMYQFYDVCRWLYYEEVIDSRFGTQIPGTYELDHYEKCQLLEPQFETDALLKDACNSIF